MDESGNLYGTTSAGGDVISGGTVFEVTRNGTETVLYRFCTQDVPCPDGLAPYGSLIMDSSGDLY
jgi:uncharacterized repeat protein (TIGR03803 family)